MQRELEKKDPGNQYRLGFLADSLCQLGDTLGETGRYAGGLKHFQEAQKVYDGLLQTNKNDLTKRTASLLCREQIGWLLVKSDKSLAAAQIEPQQQIIKGLEELEKGNLDDTDYPFRVALSRMRLAELHILAGSPKEALTPLTSALDILAELIVKEPEQYLFAIAQAEALGIQARVQRLLNDSGALESANKAVQFVEPLARKEPAYLYDLGCSRASFSSLLDPKDKQAEVNAAAAVDALKKAVDAGYDNVYKLNTDPRLASVRSRSEFQQVLQQTEANAKATKE
jgi:hypothetical protein